MKHTNFSFTSRDGLELFARAWVSIEEKPKGVVYLVHGLGEHSGRYAHVADAFNRAGFHLLGFDLRGHGLSGGKRGHTPSYDHMLDDIDIFIKESLARYPDTLPEFLYGHSLGGNLVINYGLRRSPKLRGIIASAPLLRTAFEPPKAKLAAARVMSRIAPTFTLKNGLEREALSRDQAVVKAYGQDAYVHDLLSARLGSDMLESGKYALENAADWDLPLLLIHGTADRICSCTASQEFTQLAGEQVDLELWEDYYHELHNDFGKEKVISAIIHWLEENSLG